MLCTETIYCIYIYNIYIFFHGYLNNMLPICFPCTCASFQSNPCNLHGSVWLPAVGPNSSKGWDMLRANSSLHLVTNWAFSKSIYHLKFWFDMFLHCSVLRHVYQRSLSSRTNALTHLNAFRLASTWLFVVSANQSLRAIHLQASLENMWSPSQLQMDKWLIVLVAK